jgi:LPS-assembly protein
MRRIILGILLLLLLPLNLLAQGNPNQTEIGPLLPIPSGQKGGGAPVPVEINSDSTRFEAGVAIGIGNVVVRYGAVTIYCDYAEYDPNTHDIVLRGNVRFFQDRYAFFADRAVYNIQTKHLTMTNFGGPKLPFQVLGDTVVSPNENQYTIFNGLITTSDSSKPDYYIRARTMRIYSGDRIIFSNVTMFVGRVPIFWFPYLYQSLTSQFSYDLAPGYDSVWGAYLLTSLTFPITTDISGVLRVDLRSLRGPALGLDANYHYGEGRETFGRLRIYGIDDQDQDLNQTAITRVPIGSGRYRLQYQSRTLLADDLYAVVDFNKLSDQYFLQDFYPNIFAYDPQPDTYFELMKKGEAYTLTALATQQVDDFQETMERQPELSWEVARTPLFNGPIFYEATNSGGLLHRSFAAPTGNQSVDLSAGALNPDYQAARFNSFHQFSFPNTYFGWLSIDPTFGLRGTYYTTTGSFTEANQTNNLAFGILNERGARFDFQTNAGVEGSFKLSKAYENVQARWLGIDGLRHVIQPYADFSWASQPTISPSDILPFDQYIPSTPLQAIDFPQFNQIDSLNRWTILRLGVRNRLQTRRDNATMNWLDVNTYFDVNFDNPLAQVVTPSSTSVSRTTVVIPPSQSYSNLVNRVRFQPVPWAYLSVDAQTPLSQGGFWAINTFADWTVSPNIELRVGHQYLQSNPYYQDTSEVNFYTYLRLNDNWGFSIYEDYQFKTGMLNQQTYALHRDLSSWVGSLGLNIVNNGSGSKPQIAVVVSFTLKDLPRFGLPINLNVGNAVGE